MLAYDYPLLGIFWTMLFWFIWIAWLLLLFRIFADIFRSDDLGGVMKAVWIVFVIVLPFLGVLIYLVARGDGMAKRDIARANADQEAFRSYVQGVAGSGSAADELAKFADLHSRGLMTDEEFAAQKAKLLT